MDVAGVVVAVVGEARCNVSILARLESILKPPDYCTSDLRVPDSGLGPPHFSSGNLGSITHVVHEAYSTYSVIVSSNTIFLPPNECDRGCASTPACCRTLSACTSEVAPSVASVVLLQCRIQMCGKVGMGGMRGKVRNSGVLDTVILVSDDAN